MIDIKFVRCVKGCRRVKEFVMNEKGFLKLLVWQKAHELTLLI